MTSRDGLKRRLDGLEGGENAGEPVPLCDVIVAYEEGVDPVEKYGGYVPENVRSVLREMAEAGEPTP